MADGQAGTGEAKYDYDFFVIGAGSAGVRASRFAAGFGARVAVAERGALGGTCVNVGCVPKKLFVYGSSYSAHMQDAAGFGWTVPEADFDWPALVRRKDEEIARLNRIYDGILERAGVTLMRGHARLAGPHAVEVVAEDGTLTRHSAEHILLATGGRPRVPRVPGAELGVVSDAMFSLDALPTLPERAVVVGGGYIGLEFACVLHGFGVDTTLIHRREHLLAGFDQDAADMLRDGVRAKGIDLRLGHAVDRIELADAGAPGGPRRVHVEGAGGGDVVEADLVLLATGRRPNTEGLGLETAGIATDRWGGVIVDEHFQSSVPSVLACGDLIGRMQLTPVALAEGMAIARRLFAAPADQPEPAPFDYSLVPTAVFSQPAAAMVGLTERDARDRGYDVAIYKTDFRPMKHTLSGRAERTLVKLVVDRATDRVLGCHMVGEEAADVIQGLAVALQAGATKAVFDRTIGIHPTAAEEFVTLRTAEPDATA